MKLSDAFDAFILEKRLQGLTSASIKSYIDIISIFISFVGSDMDISELTLDAVNGYILNIYSKKLSKGSVSTYIRNLRIFLVWVDSNCGRLSFDARKIKIPKSPKKNIHIYSDDEIKLIFDSASSSIDWIRARNWAILSLMLDSGIRHCEVCGLLWKDVDFNDSFFKVTGKGAKDRYVPLGYMSHLFLMDYQDVCPFRDSPFVFVDRNGAALSGNAIRLFVNRLQHKLPFELSSHKLRHNFATNFCIDHIEDSGSSDVYDLSILMGHESIETTKKYEHFAHEILAVRKSVSHLDKVYNV